MSALAVRLLLGLCDLLGHTTLMCGLALRPMFPIFFLGWVSITLVSSSHLDTILQLTQWRSFLI